MRSGRWAAPFALARRIRTSSAQGTDYTAPTPFNRHTPGGMNGVSLPPRGDLSLIFVGGLSCPPGPSAGVRSR